MGHIMGSCLGIGGVVSIIKWIARITLIMIIGGLT